MQYNGSIWSPYRDDLNRPPESARHPSSRFPRVPLTSSKNCFFLGDDVSKAIFWEVVSSETN